jgi:magnesium chelatase family protein
MLATSLTAALLGVEAHLVRVETDIAAGFPKLTMIGLPDSAIKESEGRIRAALRNCGYEFRWDRRITISMAPASLRKTGSSYDLATAVGLLAADGTIDSGPLGGVLLVGELALDGAVRPVAGGLPMMILARKVGITAAAVPRDNAREASLVPEVAVFPVASLRDAIEVAAADQRPAPPSPPEPLLAANGQPDLADVRGQLLARRALEIAAAGGHNLLLKGPPGTGKTLLARRLPGILPPLTREESLETSAIHSAWGLRADSLAARPFRAPHHTVSDAALVGGGSFPRPGELSLAHNGVLFLDELPEFRRSALESMREPLEEGSVTIARVRGVLRLPARFQLVAAMNPCPCGFLGDPVRGCRCTPERRRAYQARISGPWLDRIDLHAEVPALPFADLSGPPGEPSAAVAARVARARQIQGLRKSAASASTNSRLGPKALRLVAKPTPLAQSLLAQAVDRLGLSARAHDRLLRVARTIADLEGAQQVDVHHVAEAGQFRCEGSPPNSWINP